MFIFSAVLVYVVVRGYIQGFMRIQFSLGKIANIATLLVA